MKKLKGWKTHLFNAAMMVLAILALPEVVALIPTQYLPVIMAVSAIGNMMLREVTDSPARNKTV